MLLVDAGQEGLISEGTSYFDNAGKKGLMCGRTSYLGCTWIMNNQYFKIKLKSSLKNEYYPVFLTNSLLDSKKFLSDLQAHIFYWANLTRSRI